MKVIIDGVEYAPKEQKEAPQIDWEKVARHVPVRVWNDNADDKRIRFLRGRESAYVPQPISSENVWKHVDLLTDLWVPHIGDECPLPDGVMVEPVMRDGGTMKSRRVKSLRWGIAGIDGDIIRFRVMGLAPGWRW